MPKKLTIEKMQKLAQTQDGKCLSVEYINIHTKLKWECKEGHRWDATPSSIKRGSWCPNCGYKNQKKKTIFDMQKLAELKEGKCLSKEYINGRTNLEWECKEGHYWDATPKKIKRGSWCQKCSDKRKKLVLKKMQKLAESKGGKCLSKEYINTITKLKWECKERHQWNASLSQIQQGAWCRKCSFEKRRDKLSDFQEIAEKKGGKCLSEKYINARTRLKWECKEGHRWDATPSSIKHGSWCRKCAFKNRKKAIKLL